MWSGEREELCLFLAQEMRRGMLCPGYAKPETREARSG